MTICPQCKSEVPCTVDETCWCMKYPQVVLHTDKLKDCLCEKCLKEVIKNLGND